MVESLSGVERLTLSKAIGKTQRALPIQDFIDFAMKIY